MKKTSSERGKAAEDSALVYLENQGLCLIERNYRTPGRYSAEIDLILKDADTTIVFVEVRSRAYQSFGGAAASIGRRKQEQIIRAAQYWLMTRYTNANLLPDCRFDVVALDRGKLDWIRSAFELH